jgi:uncharacterized membrane protein YkvA (DUF1232 family)
MSNQPLNQDSNNSLAPARSPEEHANALRALYDRARITWRLFRDERVGFWPKLLPILGLIYLVSPVDLLPAWILGPLAPLGVVDDLGIALLALGLFIQAAPTDIVQEHLRELRRSVRGSSAGEQVVDSEAEYLDRE